MSMVPSDPNVDFTDREYQLSMQGVRVASTEIAMSTSGPILIPSSTALALFRLLTDVMFTQMTMTPNFGFKFSRTQRTV